ncbi:hypothetical protein DH2020_025611 [Rehmannia glutinosa]|uniref:Homeobox-leucine zipper protein n=1 Tax=Rehmannia glutinosa TaxID=99300 RepID=A0ABR0VZ86_REHGL
MSSVKMTSNNNSRRRFSHDQIDSLETTFETQSTPDLCLKQQLANNLGLQPRQVAIWFQNKRARSKSKQIEQEYTELKSNYDKLASQFEKLRKENQKLLFQLQRLRKMANRKDGEEYDKNQITLSTSENPKSQLEIDNHEPCMPSCSNLNRKSDYLEMETDDLNIAQVAEKSLISPGFGCCCECCIFIHDPVSSCQWWNFQF